MDENNDGTRDEKGLFDENNDEATGQRGFRVETVNYMATKEKQSCLKIITVAWGIYRKPFIASQHF